MPWTVAEKAFSVETYLTTHSFRKTAVLFRERFRCRKTPSKSRIHNWLNTFRTQGTVRHKCSPNSGRPRHARCDQNIQVLRDSVNVSPEESLRRRTQHVPLQISRESVRRILRYDLGLNPYTIAVKQKLTEDDMRKRVEMCQEFERRMETDPQWVNRVPSKS